MIIHIKEKSLNKPLQPSREEEESELQTYHNIMLVMPVCKQKKILLAHRNKKLYPIYKKILELSLKKTRHLTYRGRPRTYRGKPREKNKSNQGNNVWTIREYRNRNYEKSNQIEILELKSKPTEMKNSLNVFRSRLGQADKTSTKFEDNMDYSVWRIGRKNEEKWTEPERPVVHHQAYQNSPREKGQKRVERIFEEIMIENFSNLM